MQDYFTKHYRKDKILNVLLKYFKTQVLHLKKNCIFAGISYLCGVLEFYLGDIGCVMSNVIVRKFTSVLMWLRPRSLTPILQVIFLLDSFTEKNCMFDVIHKVGARQDQEGEMETET